MFGISYIKVTSWLRVMRGTDLSSCFFRIVEIDKKGIYVYAVLHNSMKMHMLAMAKTKNEVLYPIFISFR